MSERKRGGEKERRERPDYQCHQHTSPMHWGGGGRQAGIPMITCKMFKAKPQGQLQLELPCGGTEAVRGPGLEVF